MLLVAMLLAAVAASACDGAPAKAEETQSKPPTNGAVAYDADRKLVVLLTPGPGHLLTGGMQTWTWDGHLWSRKAPSVSPPARVSALVAYDEARRVIVMHGGLSRSGGLNDTWEWDGSQWSQRQPAYSPDPGQQPGSMAYDPSTHQLLLFQWEGHPSPSTVETWSWDGKDWTLLKPAHLPSFYVGSLVFDGQRLILIGESFDGDQLETWGWTGSDWRLLAAQHTFRSLLPAGFDASTRKVILYGGGPGDDTWAWDGTRWTREHPKHSPAAGMAQLLYVKSLNRLVGFVGTDVGAITGIYSWDGSDWSALGSGSPPAVAAGANLVSANDATALIRRTVVKTSPVLLPRLPDGLSQAVVTADDTGFSLRAWNDDRSIEVSLGIVVPGNSNLGAENKTIAFRRSSADYQYIARDPTGWRSLWWIERPGYWPVPALKDRSGVPYLLAATGLTDTQFFALADTLR
jgi:hypothetical protein